MQALRKLKQNFNVSNKFTFRRLNELSRKFQKNKATGGDIPLKVLKEWNFSFEEFTHCMNYAFS